MAECARIKRLDRAWKKLEEGWIILSAGDLTAKEFGTLSAGILTVQARLMRMRNPPPRQRKK